MLSTRNLAGHFNVVLIATFAADEPVEAVLAAVRGTEIDLYVTGNWRKLDPATAQAVPANVHFTGFLAEEEYWRLLQSADAVVDLTLMDNCVVCGAYEGLAATKPMLLSNNTASVELFGDSALYTDNTAPDIRRSLERLRLGRNCRRPGRPGLACLPRYCGSIRRVCSPRASFERGARQTGNRIRRHAARACRAARLGAARSGRVPVRSRGGGATR